MWSFFSTFHINLLISYWSVSSSNLLNFLCFDIGTWFFFCLLHFVIADNNDIHVCVWCGSIYIYLNAIVLSLSPSLSQVEKGNERSLLRNMHLIHALRCLWLLEIDWFIDEQMVLYFPYFKCFSLRLVFFIAKTGLMLYTIKHTLFLMRSLLLESGRRKKNVCRITNWQTNWFTKVVGFYVGLIYFDVITIESSYHTWKKRRKKNCKETIVYTMTSHKISSNLTAFPA